MSLLQVIGVAVVVGMASLLLKSSKSQFPVLLSAVGGVLLLAWFLSRISPALELFYGYLSTYELEEKGGLMMKALAVGYLTQIGSETCKDLGADSIAAKVELCGRAELMILSLPVLIELLDVSFSLVQSS